MLGIRDWNPRLTILQSLHLCPFTPLTRCALARVVSATTKLPVVGECDMEVAPAAAAEPTGGENEDEGEGSDEESGEEFGTAAAAPTAPAQLESLKLDHQTALTNEANAKAAYQNAQEAKKTAEDNKQRAVRRRPRQQPRPGQTETEKVRGGGGQTGVGYGASGGSGTRRAPPAPSRGG